MENVACKEVSKQRKQRVLCALYHLSASHWFSITKLENGVRKEVSEQRVLHAICHLSTSHWFSITKLDTCWANNWTEQGFACALSARVSSNSFYFLLRAVLFFVIHSECVVFGDIVFKPPILEISLFVASCKLSIIIHLSEWKKKKKKSPRASTILYPFFGWIYRYIQKVICQSLKHKTIQNSQVWIVI